MSMDRREWMQRGAKFALAIALGDRSLGNDASRALSTSPNKTWGGKGFSAKFLWGAATAAHQVEGNNQNSDTWRSEEHTSELQSRGHLVCRLLLEKKKKKKKKKKTKQKKKKKK